MQLTLYSKAVDDGYPPIPATTQSTIYTNQTTTPIFDYLRVSKFLSEFTTEVDKARVRKNLGIPDEYSYNWGHIGGSIELLTDLSRILSSLTAELKKHQLLILGINNTLVDLRALVGDGTSNLIGSFQKTIEAFLKDLLALLINVALNSTDIARISGGNITLGGGSSSVDSALINQIATNTTDILLLKEQVEELWNNLGSEGRLDLTPILSPIYARLDALETAIKTNALSELVITPSDGITVDSTDAGELSVLVIAHYTKIEPVDVTAECTVNSSNSNVAVWNKSTNKVSIVGSGTATLTFMFRSKSVTLKVSVGAAEPPIVTPQWLGYANTWEDLIDKASIKSVAGTWTSTTPGCLNIATNSIYAFWIVTTLNIQSITESVGSWNVQDSKYKTTVINGITYTIYMSKPIKTSSLTITITV